jgi:acetoacetyl-CoA synthetase
MKMWQPDAERIASSNMLRFQNHIFQKFPEDFHSTNHYQDLWRWSVQHKGKFWKEVLDFTKIKSEAPKQHAQIYQENLDFTKSKFFDGYLCNYAQNLLKNPNKEQTALLFWNEKCECHKWSFRELEQKTAQLVRYFQTIGVKKGDRIVAYMPNIPETICALLASAAVGCLFASCSPDFGVKGVLERFYQIQPKLLLVCPQYFYNENQIDIRSKILELAQQLPSLKGKISFSYPDAEQLEIDGFLNATEIWNQEPASPFYQELPFNHPLYVLFSSGTTGKPKCIVHSAGGALLQQLKELQLHCDLQEGMRILFFTTCGWMMWNWLVAALACNATVCLFDGSPVSPPKILWDYVAKEKIHLFGLGAKIVDFYRNKKFDIQNEYELSHLKTIMTTGSILSHECFDYIYQSVKKDLHLASISGGTDIVSCFLQGNPILPVYRGELQGAGLGMDVDVFTEQGEPTLEKGELVCKTPFPSKPLYFWNDTDGEKMKKSYFEKLKGVWTHGDYIQKTKNNGFIIYGRSDATLNPGGVRIGSAEIYRIVENIKEVEESVVIAQNWKDDVRIVLFVKLESPYQLDENLKKRIKTLLKEKASFKHIPEKIIATMEIPRTHSGKIVELAVKNIVEGRKVENIEAIANPHCLQYYRDILELQE